MAGAQSEQAKVGLSPAQRDILKERTRHEKAVQKIADKHGAAAPADRKAGVSPWKEPPASERDPVLTLPEAFRSGYRGHTRIERVATPVGRRAGGWAARGVAWAEDTGRGALREYRKRRKSAGHDDPAPVLVPLPPTRPPDVPPVPATPPTAGTDGGGRKGVSLERPEEAAEAKEPEGAEKPPEGATEPSAGGDGSPSTPEASTGPGEAADGPEPPPPPRGGVADWAEWYKWAPSDDKDSSDPAETLEPPTPAAPEPATADDNAGTDTEAKPESAGTEPDPKAEPEGAAEPKSSEVPTGRAETERAPAVAEPEGAAAGAEGAVREPESPVAEPEGAVPEPNKDSEPAAAGGGVGRMAAEVTYESVMDESDELNLMCDEDFATYERIGKRCEREIGKGDSLIAELTARGAGQGLLAWITRCKEDYGTINSQLDQLKQNTKAQGEKVVQAKALLEAGQGVYADQAKDMESVMDREFYISDAVDSEDASAHTEVYETRGA
ncbi:hypothetical protein [Streptomyces sp. DH10]|uniref:hypothetical protein n=1 Tax=Streptomyces sp. DH10 TaxID=3040121 RepID=UPI002441E222|nr:hypothetical protein [Streptomyces sp. DH10]MDG9709690.1 hypothetical protein [Streptomyces sp. DH10]